MVEKSSVDDSTNKRGAGFLRRLGLLVSSFIVALVIPMLSGIQILAGKVGFNYVHEARAENSSDTPRVHLIFDVLPKKGKGFYVYPSEIGLKEPF